MCPLNRGNSTTNWDTLLESQFPKDEICYLHGNIEDFKNLYLPNETQEDGYRTIYEKDYLRSNASHVITNLFRDAKEIVVYGLGFNDLDFELSILWGYGLSRAYREMLSKEPAAILPENFDVDFSPKVIVIDPNHNSVASRIKYLTPQITIECIHPNDL